MTIRTRDKNRASLVKTIVKHNGGKIFTVIAKRKAPKVSYEHEVTKERITGAAYNKLVKADSIDARYYSRVEENFMTMTCRTGVAKDLKGGDSTIRHCPELISVNLTNGKGYRCFSAFNVLELRVSGTTISFKEEDVLSFEEV